MPNADSVRDTLPFHLAGAFAPVREERTDHELDVIGEIPADLCGTYVRNGPNPRTGRSPAWFAGEGMLHGVRLEGGRARWYRNRWIAGDFAPNTHVVRHAGRILALVETWLPVEVTAELETVGPYTFGGALGSSMTAHPKICPRTGELLFFSQRPSRPHLTYYRADASGRVVHRAALDVPAVTFMHDFAITERYVVFCVLPVLLGDVGSPVPIRWVDDFPARIGVLPRDGGNEDLRWFDVAPCTISHTVNAFEEGDAIVLDAVRAPRIMMPHALHRFTFDLRAGRASEAELDPRFLDFPRVHPAVVGARHRRAYTIELCDFGPDGGFTRTVARQHDLETGAAVVHEFGDGVMPGECVVAARPGSAAEDDAWVILFVHRRDGSAAELVILDASRFASPPVARVRLPCHVPLGLHGEWLPDAGAALA
ncbi:carotenoid oxygenase family protein [Sorangium sp. So ce131]|uniref:carotenoid oxygenase family protein n=1 Tax=Sorangium sp. So ce131 TaxID=3133282 RepID=UPI003F5F1524